MSMVNLPWFDARLDDDDDDEQWWARIGGWDAADAAAAFLDRRNTEAAVYPEDGDGWLVIVRDSAGVEHRVQVYAQRSISYHGVEERGIE